MAMAKFSRSAVAVPGVAQGAATSSFRRASLLRRAPTTTGAACRPGAMRTMAALDRSRGTSRGESASTKAAAVDEASLSVAIEEGNSPSRSGNKASEPELDPMALQLKQQRLERRQRRNREQTTYKLSAIAASSLLMATAVTATWYRFAMHTGAADVSPFEVALTLLLVLGGTFGMEMYARYAHRILWHEFQPGWALHKSHHEPRTGPFEANDIYAIANAVPAIALCAFGFLTPGMAGGICFGLGLGITLFGISYMFVHDGMIHRRFPVGPIAELPYLQRVAIAHQIHHSERFEGVPYGLFFGPQELEAIDGGGEYLDMLVEQSNPKASTSED